MLIQIHPENPQPRLIKQVAECLKNGGVLVIQPILFMVLAVIFLSTKPLNAFVK